MASPTDVVDGKRAKWGVSDDGQLMGAPNEAGLASKEREGIYEHLAIGTLEEGYTLAYITPGGQDNIKYDVYQVSNGIVPVSHRTIQSNAAEFVKVTESRTDDRILTVRQTFTISKNGTRVVIRMDIANTSRTEIEDLLIKRYADIDVDTGGSAGWAGFLARWDKNRDSVFTYNLDEDAPEGRKSHIVNMVAMPGDLPLDKTFAGVLGANQYAVRDDPAPLAPLPTGRVDGNGILQWKASRLLPGESVRINMYYDTWRTFWSIRSDRTVRD